MLASLSLIFLVGLAMAAVVQHANFASSVCEFRLNRCEHIASPVYGYGSSV